MVPGNPAGRRCPRERNYRSSVLSDVEGITPRLAKKTPRAVLAGSVTRGNGRVSAFFGLHWISHRQRGAGSAQTPADAIVVFGAARVCRRPSPVYRAGSITPLTSSRRA